MRAAPLLLVALVACAKKKEPAAQVPPPDRAGLAAVPATARVVIGVKPKQLAGSRLVDRAIDQMLDRDPDLAARVERLAEGCKLDWSTLESVHLAMTDVAAQPMLVATGRLAEADLAACVRSTVGAGGGTLSATQVDGRTLYEVVEGQRSVYFGFGRSDTVVLSGSRDLVIAGLGPDKKVLDDAAMKALIGRARVDEPVWAVGVLDPALGQRLLRLTQGKLTTPPRAFLVALDPTGGLEVELAAVMSSEDDAKVLESQVDPTLSLVAFAAQARGLGPLAAKIAGSRDGDVVKFGVSLTEAEVNELLSKVDSRPPPDEDAAPGD